MIKIKSQWEIERPFNLLSWGHWFTFGNLVLALLFSFFYLTASPTPDSFVGWFYLIVKWLSHFAFLSIGCFILTIFPIITLFPYKRHIRGVSAIMASIFQMLLFLDVLAYRGLGYHLSTSSLDQLSEVEDIYLAHMGNGYWFLISAVFFAILLYQIVLSNFTWKRIHQLQNISFKNYIPRFLVSAFVISHLLHLFADATLNPDIAKQRNLFPLSYPLTAKTLLAEYELLDLNQYKLSKTKLALINKSTFVSKAPTKTSCDISDTPNLKVVFVEKTNYQSVTNWLQKYNVHFQSSSQLNLSKDLSTAIFNFSTGLPGLYQDLTSNLPLEINQQLGQEKITIEIHHGKYELPAMYSEPQQSKVFVFYDKEQAQLFYRTKTLLIGIEQIKEIEAPIQAQNIVASYLSASLKCSEYVTLNLVDSALSNINSNSLFTNYSNGHFSILYKDKAMLFQQGELVSNQTFSNGRNLDDTLDLFIIEKAIAQITAKRLKVESSNSD